MEARRITERLEIHYTPKHGSWLNMAEIEIGVLARQCRTGAYRTKASCGGRWERGRTSATGTWCEWTGASPSRAHQAEIPLPSNSK